MDLIKGRLVVEYTKVGGAEHNWVVYLDSVQIGWLHMDGADIGGALDEEHMDLYFDDACRMARAGLH